MLGHIELRYDCLRLGKECTGDDSARPRPILVTLEDFTKRRLILEKSKELKTATSITIEDENLDLSKVFIKKDQHPFVRREWGRLHAVMKEEKSKPENAGFDINIDPK